MKFENTVKIMKEIHKDRIIMVKVGSFYNCWSRDAVIMAYLFGYNLKKVDNIYTCGFPASALNKVLVTIEKEKISYLVSQKSENYEVINEEDYKSENRYNELYSKANKYINRKNRITNIYSYFMENINEDNIKEKIQKVEDIIYEI